METIKVEYRRPWLYPKQLKSVFGPERIGLIEASTKAGKTVSCIAWLVEQAFLGGGNGRNYWWVAPVTTQADIAFKRLMRFLPRETYAANLTVKTITLINGAMIWFKGGDRPDTLYGDDVHAAVIDEASRLKETAWHAVRSTLTFTRGPMRIIGNVKGRRNWFYALARRAEQNEEGMAFHRLIAHDAVEAGVLSLDEVEAAKRDLPERVFRELYLAQPSDDGGNPFGIDAIGRCVAPLTAAAPHVWGWDLAKHVDWTVGIALDRFGYACRYERFQLPWDATMTRIIATTGSVPALVDSTGVGDPILEMLQKKPGTRFEGYHFTGPSKQKLMEGLAVAIQQKGITYPDGEIRMELEQFEYTYTASGVRYGAPEGFHDDCVCALALAVMHKQRALQPLRVTADVLRRSQIPTMGMRRQ
jgi:hypothetical protein